MGVDVDHYRRVAEQMAGKPGAINNSAAAVLMLQLCDLFERRWIPVSERLPEEEQDVLVFTHEGTHVAALDEDGIWCPSHGDGWMFPDVTHWTPLPEPPEVK